MAAEFQRTVDGLSWLVGLAVFLTWWAPYLIGLVNLVLIGLFPLRDALGADPWHTVPAPCALLCRAVLHEFLPLWWALIDQAHKVAGATAPQQTEGYAAALTTMLSAFAWSTVVTVAGHSAGAHGYGDPHVLGVPRRGQSLARRRLNTQHERTSPMHAPRPPTAPPPGSRATLGPHPWRPLAR